MYYKEGRDDLYFLFVIGYTCSRLREIMMWSLKPERPGA